MSCEQLVEKLQVSLDECDTLRIEVARLKEELSFLKGHQTMAAGLRGERLISKIVNGKPTSHVEVYDVETSTGTRIEVKYSKLNSPSKLFTTKRWAWGRIFGAHNKKAYDYLLLVGDIDERYKDLYLAKGTPYIFFLIPQGEVEALTMSNQHARGIQLTTNPKIAKSKASLLFHKYQISFDEISGRFAL